MMDKTLHVTFTADVTASDPDKGVIVGKVVPYNTFGNTSLGPVAFAAGSFGTIPDTVKLLLEHDGRRPIGRATGFIDGPDHMTGTFKLSRTTAGKDALIEAAEGLRDGLSVGANIIDFEDTEQGYLVTAAELVEVSLVATPAFSQAGVEKVAASSPEPSPEPSDQETVNMEHETPEVEPAAEVVEASDKVEASAPTRQYVTVQHRDVVNMTAGLFAKRQLEAQAGDREAQLVVQAALADNTTTTGAGLIPTRFLTEVISVIDARRPVVDSITRDVLPDAGDEFKIPRVTQKPSVAEQAAEGDEVSSTAFTLDFLTVPVKTFSGGERISRQLIERSDPAFLDRLLIEMGAQYAQRTDEYAYSVLTSGEAASSGATIYGAIADAIADSWDVMRFAPDRLLVCATGTGDINFAKLLAEVDGEDRPLFASANPVNAGGLMTQGTTQGTVAGLQVVVDANVGDIEARVYPSAAATFYEVAGAPINVSVQDVSTLEVEVAVYGYVACAIKYPTAVRIVTL
jgi:HK97 family phage prohead protease/HK97 family phage major capsid protein